MQKVDIHALSTWRPLAFAEGITMCTLGWLQDLHTALCVTRWRSRLQLDTATLVKTAKQLLDQHVV